MVKSLKIRLDKARRQADMNKDKSLLINQKQQTYNSKKNNNQRNHRRRDEHINDVDYEQAKLLKRNFHGDEYDDYGQNSASTVYFNIKNLILLLEINFVKNIKNKGI